MTETRSLTVPTQTAHLEPRGGTYGPLVELTLARVREFVRET